MLLLQKAMNQWDSPTYLGFGCAVPLSFNLGNHRARRAGWSTATDREEATAGTEKPLRPLERPQPLPTGVGVMAPSLPPAVAAAVVTAALASCWSKYPRIWSSDLHRMRRGQTRRERVQGEDQEGGPGEVK